MDVAHRRAKISGEWWDGSVKGNVSSQAEWRVETNKLVHRWYREEGDGYKCNGTGREESGGGMENSRQIPAISYTIPRHSNGDRKPGRIQPHRKRGRKINQKDGSCDDRACAGLGWF